LKNTWGCSSNSQWHWKVRICCPAVLLVRSSIFYWSDSEMSSG
jgi:hypothetical protein